MTGVYQSVNNPDIITTIGEAPDMEVVNSFKSNPKLNEAMDSAGVIGMPDVKILNKVQFLKSSGGALNLYCLLITGADNFIDILLQ